MEKRRRERINKSLNELKSILLNALRKDVSIFINSKIIINFTLRTIFFFSKVQLLFFKTFKFNVRKARIFLCSVAVIDYNVDVKLNVIL